MDKRTRAELLEQLYDLWWNKVGLLESELPGYSLISYDDANAMEDICTQIEATYG